MAFLWKFLKKETLIGLVVAGVPRAATADGLADFAAGELEPASVQAWIEVAAAAIF